MSPHTLFFAHSTRKELMLVELLPWGIIGALAMRAILIAFAGVLLGSLHWMIYVFGAFLILTGLKFLRGGEHALSLGRNRLVRLAKRFYPVTEGYEGQRFWVKRNGVRYMTPLFLVLLLVESTDLIFAVRSIPAIYAVTDDPFVVFTSNVFAILGLRALHFVLAGYLARRGETDGPHGAVETQSAAPLATYGS